MRASIVLPTYNERETLPVLLRRLRDVTAGGGWACEVIVVDDASPDGTGEVAARIGAELSGTLPVTVLARPAKAGLASAVVAGVGASRAEVIVVMDGDLSHPPEVVPALLREIAAGADLAVGSRYVPGGGIVRWPLARRMVSRVAVWLARRLCGVSAGDPVSGLFAARRGVFDGVRAEGVGYKILLELLVLHPDARTVEVPYVFTNRTGGRSKLDLGEILNFVRLLRRLSGRRAARGRPASLPPAARAKTSPTGGPPDGGSSRRRPGGPIRRGGGRAAG